MKLLALDTSSLACSVALQIDAEVSDRHEEQARQHTRLLMPMIESLLKEASVALNDLDAIVLGNGPGSFIGMRIAASVAQGLAFGAGLNIVPVSSLSAVAAQVFAEYEATEVVVAQDAHMQEVYLGVFARSEKNLPTAIVKESLHSQSSIAGLANRPDIVRVAAGSGWQRYPDLLEMNKKKFADVVKVLHPAARYLLPLGCAEFQRGNSVNPKDVAPAYLRHKVAEVPSR